MYPLIELCLQSFFEIALSSSHEEVRSRAEKLQSYAEERFGISFSVAEFDENDEDAPVLVEGV